MERKLIFLDIDGTILIPGMVVRREVMEGLRRARNRGHQIFICTGRAVSVLPAELDDLTWDGVIASVGSDIWIHGQNVYRGSLEVEQIRKASRLLEGFGAVYVLEGYDHMYVCGYGRKLLLDQVASEDLNPEMVRWRNFFRQKKNVRSFEEWDPDQTPIPKVTFMLWGKEYLEKLESELKDDFYMALFQTGSGDFFNGELISGSYCGSLLLDASSDCGQYTVPYRAELVLRDGPELLKKCEGLAEPYSAVRKDGKIVLTASGISTQASMPEKGKSALTALARLVTERELLPEKETEGFRLICDINADHHGTALDVFCEDGPSGPVNLVATQLRMEDGRLVIGFIGKYPITAGDFPFEERARKAAGARDFELKVTKLTAPNYFEPDRQVVKRLTEVSNRVLDRQDVPFVMSGGTYARKLPNALAFGTGMELPPAPEGLFRPGHGDYHQPDESIRLLRIEKALEVYICRLLEIDSLGSLLA